MRAITKSSTISAERQFEWGPVVYKHLNSVQPQYFKSVLVSQTCHYAFDKVSDRLSLSGLKKYELLLAKLVFLLLDLDFWNSVPALLSHLCHFVHKLRLTVFKC